MKNRSLKTLLSAALVAGVSVCLPAQSKLDAAAVGRIQSQMSAALTLREQAAAAVAQGREKPAAAIARLGVAATSSGLELPADANLAVAATDVGHRLIALRRPAEAELFFKAAETALTAAVKLPKASAAEKARYLGQRASLRANFLNAPTQAKADIEAAIALQPDDAGLQTARRLITAGRHDVFTAASQP